MNSNKTSILIADDHHLVRIGILSILKNEKDFEVTGDTDNGIEALKLIKENKPDIAILDIDMPGLSGLEIAKKIYDKKLPVKVTILTMHRDKAYFQRSRELDVKAFILKDSISDDLIECLRIVASGEYYISPRLTSYLIESNKPAEKPEWYRKLTIQELKVLKLLSQNKTSKHIADELYISTKTVENHRANITSKLNLKGTNSLLVFALENKPVL